MNTLRKPGCMPPLLELFRDSRDGSAAMAMKFVA